ncbi:MAG: DnaJ domain-containing protein [Planctomycetes bacterium]|nr:DnaJ domain-containing protein [Planctomycetota bacterium]
MNDPYQILGMSPDASEAEIRRRYLELVRAHSPDRDPERFNEVHEAYSSLRDPVARMEKLLFQPDRADTLASVLADVRRRLRDARLPTEVLLSLAKKS